MVVRVAHWAFVALFAAIAGWLAWYGFNGFGADRANAAEAVDYFIPAAGFALSAIAMIVFGRMGQALSVALLSAVIAVLALRFGLPLAFVEESAFYWVAFAIAGAVSAYSVLLVVRASPEALTLGLAAAFAGFLTWVGVFLVMLGYQLISASGSPYYVLAGLVLLVVALFTLRRNIWAPRLYALLIAATVVWSLFEAGLDFWPLLARLAAFIVVGLWFALPTSRQLFYAPRGELGARRDFRWAEASAGATVLVLALASFQGSPVKQGSKFDVAAGEARTDWRAYGATTLGTRFAELNQITPENVKGLKQVWSYRTRVPYDSKNTPLMVDGLVYVCTGYNTLIALNADTGQEIWRTVTRKIAPENDPAFAREATYPRTCRGLGYYEVGKGGSALASPEPSSSPTPAPAPAQRASRTPSPAAPAIPADCPTRIITNTTDARLIAVDAKTGAYCQSFGSNGQVNLRAGLGPHFPNAYFTTSAPLVAKDIIVVGGWVVDSQSMGMPSGVLRAYSAKTGEFVWAWDMGKPNFHGAPDEGGEFTRGTPNVWSHTSYDPDLNLIYAPTGNSSPDYFGGDLRTKEAEAHSSSVVAIDAATGAERWTYQTVHHDVWDYDVPSQPVLVNVRRDGKVIPAVAAPTKRGEIFLLDRRDGKPIYPTPEMPVPQNPEKGEWVPKTQPFSPLPNFREDRSEKDMWGMTPLDQLYCRIEFKKMRYEGHFTPIMKGVTPTGGRPDATYAERKFVEGRTSGGTFQYPGNAGGFNWGSVSVDADNGLLVAAPLLMGNRITQASREERSAEAEARRKRQEIWDKAYPRPKKEDDASQMGQAQRPAGGVGAGPAAPGAGAGGGRMSGPSSASTGPSRVPYTASTAPFLSKFFVPFLGETQMPCFEPPWSVIAAIDLNTNTLLWKRPAGTMERSGPFRWNSGLPITVGVPLAASSLTTRGGLVFHAGTVDATLRAWDLRTGEVKWEGKLPQNAQATPMSYLAPSGRQIVLITVPNPQVDYPLPATARKPIDDQGGWVIAFALEGR